jgi:hypothetical protein
LDEVIVNTVLFKHGYNKTLGVRFLDNQNENEKLFYAHMNGEISVENYLKQQLGTENDSAAVSTHARIPKDSEV